jgi:hypothetical protein
MTSKIRAVREEITSVREEAAWTHDGRIPPAAAAARIGPAVDAIAARFAESVIPANLASQAGPDRVLADWLTPRVPNGAGARLELGPMIAWLFGDLLKQRLGEVLAHADYIAGPPLEERPARLAELNEHLRRLETEEEALVEAAEAAGLEVYRRPDLDWGIVLAYDPDGNMAVPSAAPSQLVAPAAPPAASDQVQAQSASFLGSIL